MWPQLIMAGIGLGMSLYGGIQTHDAAKQYNQAQIDQMQTEQKMEDLREQHMELSASRMRIENAREVNRQSAVALANATSQGAGTGSNSSGLAGGRAQVQSSGGWNELGINQNLQFGHQMFGLNREKTNEQIQGAQAQMDMQTGQAWGQAGSQLMGASSAAGRLFSGFNSDMGGHPSYIPSPGFGPGRSFNMGTY